MKGRAQGYNPYQMQQDTRDRLSSEDRSRNLKRRLGIITEVHPERLAARIRIAEGSRGATRLFGQAPGKPAPFVPITDDPLDLLARFGGVDEGMVVEVFYRGLSENTLAFAHIVGATSEEARVMNLQQEHIDDTASSLPFKPMGIF